MRFALLLVSLLASSSSAWACRYQPEPFNVSAKAAPLVFIGRIEAVDHGTATFTVEAASKGTTAASTVKVFSKEGSSCGLRFRDKERWLILASKEEGRWVASLPSNSALLTDDRGLQQPMSWELVTRALTAAQLKPLIAADACVKARFELMAFLDALPRACEADAQCSLAYLDTHACYPPVVVGPGAEKVVEAKSSELQALQTRAKTSCPFNAKDLPACSAMTRARRCEAKVCTGAQL